MTPAPRTLRTAKRDCSVEDDQFFRRGLAVFTGHEFVFDLLSFVESRQARLFDGGNVDEGVLGAVARLDESISLCWIEPFYRSGGHVTSCPYLGIGSKYWVSACRLRRHRSVIGPTISRGNPAEEQKHLSGHTGIMCNRRPQCEQSGFLVQVDSAPRPAVFLLMWNP